MSRNERGSGDSYTNRARESRAPEIERDKGAPFTINLFGAIEIFRDGQALTSFRSQKTLVLFAYLICEDRPVTREYLAGLGWPEANQQQALGLLRRSLHNLSSKLPGSLVIDRRTAWFCAESTVHVDVCTFSAMAAQDDPTAWAQAAALYRAPFLEGV